MSGKSFSGKDLPNNEVVTRVTSDLFNADFCASCEMMGLFTQTAHGFVGWVGKLMHEGILNLFMGVLPLWFVISLFLLLIGSINIAKFARNFLFIIITFIILKNNGPIIVSGIFALSLELIGSLGQVTFLQGDIQQWSKSNQFVSAGIVNLVYSMESSLVQIFDYASALTTEASLFQSIALWFLMTVFVYVPFTAISAMFFAKLVIAVFRVILLSVFFPILLFFSAFDWGRDMGKAALKTLLASIFIAVACSAAISLVVFTIGELINTLIATAPTKGVGDDSLKLTEIWPVLFMLATFAWMAIAFQVDANGVANSWAGSMLSSAGAAMITTAMTAMTILGAKAGGKLGMSTMGGITGLPSNAIGNLMSHGAGMTRSALGAGVGGMMGNSAAEKASRLYEIMQGSHKAA